MSKHGRLSSVGVALLLFGSGLTALIYQTAWQRLFRLVFGGSTAASAAVLGIFLGGLGVGSVWLGARAERHPKPLGLYGNLEAIVALLAAISPLTLYVFSWLYLALGGSEAMGTVLATIVRLIIAALVMGPAVIAMGGTLPAAARAFEQEGDAARRRLALLYATNTLGAVLGALLATFVLFEVLGTRLTLWAAALLNLLIAMLARGAARALPALDHTGEQPPSLDDDGGPPPTQPEHVHPALVYTSLAIVGFAFIALELVWYRMLAPILGGSSYTFGIVLAMALAGIGLGGYAYARRSAARPATLGLLGWTLVLEALAIGLPFALGDTLALYMAYVRPMAALGFGTLVFTWIVCASVVVLPAACVAGYQFPVLFALLGRGRERVARHVGQAYAFNTLGSIGGALVGGFVLLPMVGAVGTWRAVVVLLAALGALVCLYANRTSLRLATLGPLALALIAGLCARAHGPGPTWRHSAIGAGRFDVSNLDRNALIAAGRDIERDLLWERDGIESSVAVLGGDGLSFWVNGKNDGSIRLDRGTQTMLGLTPAALHPAPKSAFVLGLGTGMSAGWLASVPGMERVDVAELEPAVLELARAARQVNQDALARPNVHVFSGDGREFLLAIDRTYDIIASEPSNPYRAGIASVFTTEFYAAAARKLNPGGIFAQWVQGYEVDVQSLRTVLRTLKSAFPFVEIWHTQSEDLLLLASAEPRSYDAGALAERLKQEPFRSALPRMWLVEGVEGLLSHFLATNEVATQLAEALDPSLNTDDGMLLEHAFARQVGSKSASLSTQLAQLALKLGQARPAITGHVDWTRTQELLGRGAMVARGSARIAGLGAAAERRLRAIDRGCVRSSFEAALSAWPEPHGPLDAIETFVLGNAYAARGDVRALAVADELAARGFEPESKLVKGRSLLSARRPADALDELLAGLAGLRAGSIPLCETTRDTLLLIKLAATKDPVLAGRALEALLQGPLAAYQGENDRRLVAQAVASVLPDPARCITALGRDLEQPEWDLAALSERMVCLRRAGHPLAAQAEADLTRFLENTTGSVEDGVVNEEAPPRVAR
jgi:predicted membrane-bound spermidine synthase